MLPSRPSPRNGGLPTPPRSRSVGRSTQGEPSSSRYGREQSSRSNVTPTSSVPRSQQPMPLRSSTRDGPISQQRSNKPYKQSSVDRKESDASSSTISSTTSSFLDRLRGGGDTSSRTSLEDDYEPPKPVRGHVSKSVGQDSCSSEEDPLVTTGAGHNLWGRIASAAGTLGVDVGRAWTTNVAVRSGEETPPGEDSRLTRAMKAYHIEKARDPSDLPEWLFEEHERRPAGRSRFVTRQNSRDDDYEEPTHPSRSRGLREIYDTAAAPSSSSRPPGNSDRSTPNRFANESTGPSKATNRLKALRDAKRQNSRLDEAQVKSSSDGEKLDGRDGGTLSERKPPRVGLPSGPGGRPRRI